MISHLSIILLVLEDLIKFLSLQVTELTAYTNAIQCAVHFLWSIAIHVPIINLLFLCKNTVIDIVPNTSNIASKIKLLLLLLIQVTWCLLLLCHEPLV